MRALVLSLLFAFSSPVYAAVSLDITSSSSSSSSTALTWTHVTASGATMLVVGVGATAGGAQTTGVTYNSVALTLGRTDNISTIWYLANPSSGSHSIVASQSAGSQIGASASSWLGTGTTPNTNNGSTSQNPSIALTTTSANCFLVEQNNTFMSASPGTATSGQTTFGSNAAISGILSTIGGYRATTTAGAYTETWTAGGTINNGTSVLALCPPPPFDPTQGFFFMVQTLIDWLRLG